MNVQQALKKTFRYRESIKSTEKRRQYLKSWYKALSAQKNIIYLDGMGFDSSTQRDYGRNSKGVRVYD